MSNERAEHPRVHFSARTSWDLTENELSSAIQAARAEGRALVDLTESNPTRAGLGGPEELVALLGHPRGASYAPIAFGHPHARAAVARYYRERGMSIDEARIALSASTSEAYAWLFKLLTNPGDKVLTPTPSYPLFDFLATLEDVSLAPYPLLREEGFRVDLGALEAAIDDRTRAIIAVHPNNPTGTFMRRDDAEAIEEICQRRGLALIVDEVFGDYAHAELSPDRLPSFVGERRALTFVLSGLSKVVAMPQLKLGWIVICGPDELVLEALRRLEVIADTYLSVGTPVQLALPEILGRRASVQADILARVEENLRMLDSVLQTSQSGVRRLDADGGWYALLEVPRTRDEDEWTKLLVREEGIIVHPGYFFDMPAEGYLVLSLLPEPRIFRGAIERLIKRLGEG